MRKRRTIRWKSLLALSVGMAAVALFVFFGSRQERREVVGTVIAGYRYRFTLSTVWQRDTGRLRMLDVETGLPTPVDDQVFTPRPSPVLEWTYRHLLHRPPPNSSEIRLTTYTIRDLPAFNFMHRFQEGYPEPILTGQERILTHRHTEVDGCPTTIVSLEQTELKRTHRGTQVLIDVSHHTIVYDLHGFSISPTDEVSQEIQAILSSFHVEKIAG